MDYKPQQAKNANTVQEALDKCKDPILQLKLDGWRGIIEVHKHGPVLYSRTGHVYSERLPEMMEEFTKLPVGTVLDGEIVDMGGGGSWALSTVLGSKKVTTQEQRDRLIFVAFDVLRVGQVEATHNPYRERYNVMREMLQQCQISPLRAVPIANHPATKEQHEHHLEQGFEGSIVKDLAARYAPGKRGHGWFKLKGTVTVDCVVMDVLMDGKGQNTGLAGRFVVGQYRGGELVERAKVNCPDQAARRDMTDNPTQYIGRVVEIKIYGANNGWRHPTFIKWREDKAADECDYRDE